MIVSLIDIMVFTALVMVSRGDLRLSIGQQFTWCCEFICVTALLGHLLGLNVLRTMHALTRLHDHCGALVP